MDPPLTGKGLIRNRQPREFLAGHVAIPSLAYWKPQAWADTI
jgi:hypothetical protein